MQAANGTERPARRTGAEARKRRRQPRTSRGAALAALLLSALSVDAFSTGGPRVTTPSSATARVRAHTKSRTAQHSQHSSGGHHPKSSLSSSATVAEIRGSSSEGGVSSSSSSSSCTSERRRRRRPTSDAALRAGIRRRSSICGSESRISTGRRYVEDDREEIASIATAAASRTGETTENSSSMPPWLAQLSNPTPTRGQVRDQLFELRRFMSERSNLSSTELHAVGHALESASQGSLAHLSGAIDFCSLLVETMEMGRDALIAAAFHYCGCVRAREEQAAADDRGEGGRSVVTGMAHHPSMTLGGAGTNRFAGEGFDAAYLCTLAGSGIEAYGASAVKIALDSARLKGTEAVAAAVSDARGHSRMTREEAENLKSLMLSNNASGDWSALAIRCAACLYRLRGLQSHRSSDPSQVEANFPSKDEIAVGRDALHIYAPLAHRLGMHKLKSELEGAAFRALYKRQHRAVHSLLYSRSENDSRDVDVGPRGIPVSRRTTTKSSSGPLFFAEEDSAQYVHTSASHQDEDDTVRSGMRSVLDDISHQVKRMLHEDSHLMDNVSTVHVTARIKEPYSLWRKLLKTHWKKIDEDKAAEGQQEAGLIRPLSVLDVHDAIALRVVLGARKLSPGESDGDTALREHDLCYHVQSLCTDGLGPPLRTVKDYIRHPKPNGYQSLHYSSRMRWHGDEWPFEVQIRSGDMHRVAEFGLAAHWEYKTRSKPASPNGNEASSADSTDDDDLDSASFRRSVADWSKAAATDIKNEAHPPTAIANAAVIPPPASSIPHDQHDSLLFATVAEADPLDYTHSVRAERARARTERLAPYIEALSAARTDLARERVFVFLNAGGVHGGESIVSLPAGSSVLDALREEERRTGAELGLVGGDTDAGEGFAAASLSNDRRPSVLRNGGLTGMTQRLENADVLTFFAGQPLSA